ncbi:MAG: hypothetical protein WC683_01870 [bacterium]
MTAWRETQGDPTGREVVYWSVGGHETELTHETMEEAIDYYLEEFALPGGKWADNLPDEIEVVGFARVQLMMRPGDTLERTLECIDEEYGDPDGGWTEPTPAMLAAEAAYHAVVLAEYEPWMCEPVVRRQVDVRAWLAEHDERG